MKKLSYNSKRLHSKPAPSKTNQYLIGMLIFLILLLLCSCKQTEYIYINTPKEPILCIEEIKTPLDMANCLNEYKLKY